MMIESFGLGTPNTKPRKVAIETEETEQITQIEQSEIVNVWKVLGRRWALLILKVLNTKEAIRFNELKRLMPGISSTVLANCLLELECEGLVSKKIYLETPPKVEYRLTVRARELGVILKELWRWTQRWKAPATMA